jgi:hypothetical protein
MSTRPANETTPAFALSERTPVKLPLALLGFLLSCVAAGAIAYATVRTTLSDHTDRIVSVEREQQQMREIVIRIDENVKRLVRSEERGRD